MSLYQKYRPQKLSEVKGNRDVVITLKNLLKDKENVPHAFLFHGPTGCGKTTLARIIATELGCKEKNLNEIDTAQFTGIDTVRNIRNMSQFVPLGGGIKVFLIDEVHRMTNDAQNAFLKILEDTPPHIYFILCTTNEKSLLPTIRGRCTQFQVRTLPEASMLELLTEIAGNEGSELEEDVARQIVKSSEGHPRNALTILEQVLATPSRRRLKVAEQANVLESQAYDLAKALLNKSKWRDVARILEGLKEEDSEGVRRMVLAFMKTVLLKGENNHAAYVMECFIEPFYNTGFPGLVFACYQVIEG